MPNFTSEFNLIKTKQHGPRFRCNRPRFHSFHLHSANTSSNTSFIQHTAILCSSEGVQWSLIKLQGSQASAVKDRENATEIQNKCSFKSSSKIKDVWNDPPSWVEIVQRTWKPWKQMPIPEQHQKKHFYMTTHSPGNEKLSPTTFVQNHLLLILTIKNLLSITV